MIAVLNATHPSEKQRRQPGYALVNYGTRNKEKRAPSVTSPAIGAAEAACDDRETDLERLSSSLEQAEAAAGELTRQFATRDDAGGRASTRPSRKIKRPERKEYVPNGRRCASA